MSTQQERFKEAVENILNEQGFEAAMEFLERREEVENPLDYMKENFPDYIVYKPDESSDDEFEDKKPSLFQRMFGK